MSVESYSVLLFFEVRGGFWLGLGLLRFSVPSRAVATQMPLAIARPAEITTNIFMIESIFQAPNLDFSIQWPRA